MKTTLNTYTVDKLVEGFVYSSSEDKGLFGLNGVLTIQPEYQRNYVYDLTKQEAGVVESVLKGYPLGLVYFVKDTNGNLAVLDGQQRITSLGRFIKGQFSIETSKGVWHTFDSLDPNIQQDILDYEILAYHCEGTETEIKQWFRTINIAGVPLNDQELLNAIYSGPFITSAKKRFSRSSSAENAKWGAFIKGSAKRQDYLAEALDWISEGEVSAYMAKHRNDKDSSTLEKYMEDVTNWIMSVFTNVYPHQKGLDWGRLYRTYNGTAYKPADVTKRVEELYGDTYVTAKAGIFEYILGGEKDTKLLNVRVFGTVDKNAQYAKQTKAAKAAGESNCPLCVVGGTTKIWDLKEMDADHVTPWSLGGATNLANCQMLCKTHNRAKGNR